MSGAPGQAARTPGQAAYEAGPLGWVSRGIWPPVPWEELTPQDHAWWDKVARANDPWPDWALLADARQEAEKLRAENERLREQLAAAQERPAPGTLQHLRAQLAIAQSALRDIAMGGVVTDGKMQPLRDPSVHADQALVAIAAAPEPAGERPAPGRDLDDLFAEALATFTADPKPTPDLGTAWRLLDQARAERDQAMHRVRELTSGILAVAENLEQSAAKTAPSAKSRAETAAAKMIRGLLDVE